MDVDLLIPGSMKERAKSALIENGFTIRAETQESLHFCGSGNLDLLLANREPTRKMLERAGGTTLADIKCLEPEDIIGLKIQAYVNNRKREYQDKADIAAIIENCEELNWDTIKNYADIFEEWDTIQQMKSPKRASKTT